MTSKSRLALATVTACLLSAAPLHAQDIEKVACPENLNLAAHSDNEVEGDTYECGIVEVPENYDRPDGRMIELVYFRMSSTSDSPAGDPLLYLSGGPGGSALHEFTASASNNLLSNIQQVRKSRDIVVYDQRGTGLSSPLVCGPAQAAIGAAVELLPEMADMIRRIESAGGFGQQMLNMIICSAGYAGLGVDLAQYNSVNSAYDMAALMDALGYKQYNLYGTSYGTKLSQVAVRSTPSRIRSIVLDGTTPINGGVAATAGIEGQEQYVQIFAQCAADPACNEAYPNLPERFGAVLDRLAENPITLSQPIVPGGLIGPNFPGMTIDQIDVGFFHTMISINNKLPYNGYHQIGQSVVTGHVPAIIAAIEENDVETIRAAFEDWPEYPFAPPLAQEFPDEGVMKPNNEFVAASIQTLLAEAEKAQTLTANNTPREIWVGTVIRNLQQRLEAGEDQVEVIRDLINFGILPAKGIDRQVLIDFANEHMPEEAAAQLNQRAESMTARDVRATMWHINDIATAMSFIPYPARVLVTYAVNCQESVVNHTQADVDAAVAKAEFPQLDEFDESSWPLFELGCSYLPVSEHIDASFQDPIVDNPTPALLIQGGMDTQTPLREALPVADFFTHSKVAIFNSEGHVVASKTPTCPGTIAAQFLNDPLGELDTSCADEFTVDFVLPN